MKQFSLLKQLDIQNTMLFIDWIKPRYESNFLDKDNVYPALKEIIDVFINMFCYVLGEGWTAKEPNRLVRMHDTLLNNRKFLAETDLNDQESEISISEYAMNIMSNYIDFVKEMWEMKEGHILTQINPKTIESDLLTFDTIMEHFYFEWNMDRQEYEKHEKLRREENEIEFALEDGDCWCSKYVIQKQEEYKS